MTGVSAVTMDDEDVLLAAAAAATADVDGGHSRRHNWRTVSGADDAWPVRRFWYMYGSSSDGCWGWCWSWGWSIVPVTNCLQLIWRGDFVASKANQEKQNSISRCVV